MPTTPCNTDICHAVCCQATSWSPLRPGPCEFLRDDYKCQMHFEGGICGKPKGCYDYPANQADIDMVNRQAEDAGFSDRCHLTVE